MKSKITAFINELIIHDYILFGGAFVLFILFIILGIALRRRIIIAIFFILLSFVILFGAPTVGYIKMHEYLFSNSLKVLNEKKLTFTKAVVINATITNESKRHFKSCKITAKAHKVSKNKLKSILYSFKSFQKMSIVVTDIQAGQVKEFKMFLEPFTYSKDYYISLGAKCK